MTPSIDWNEHGLVPAVAQDATTGAVLMVAWMNKEALARTRATGWAHFYSRSRQSLWKKGETSGHTLRVRELRIDCDADTVLLRVDPSGPACHTGKPSCFFRALAGAADVVSEDDGPPGAAAAELAAELDRLYDVLRQRRDQAPADASYTRALLDGGFPAILAKIAEEHAELAAELPAGDVQAVVHEAADLVYHLLVGLVARDIAPAAVWRELARRAGRSGHDEKASRGAPA
jgi:phosphoribosyl-ATP pyrophosphohydrolase/phosphoribosyl-AMP cyclohydrolase